MVDKWFADFKRGRTNTDDAEHSGRLNLAVVPENMKKVHKILLADCKLKLREILLLEDIRSRAVFTDEGALGKLE